MNNVGRNICYSLPRLITPAIQCSFCAYMWELYTTEFGWSMSEWGVVQSTCTFTQIISFIGLGGLFILIDASAGEAKNWTKWILVSGTFIHWFSYFLLIALPIQWHGVKTPYVDSLFGKASNFRHAMFGGPVALSSMASSRFWYRFMRILWPFVKLFWVILYIPMKISFFCGGCCMKLLRIIRSRRTKLTRILPVLETLRDPACSACCNTTCCNNFAMRARSFGRWMGTKTFGIYMLALAHGLGVSAHELSNTALPYYIYDGNDSASGGSDTNGEKKGMANTTNLPFFFFANLMIYLLFSLFKFYTRSKFAITEIFYILSILFLVMHFPIIPTFIAGTQQESATYKAGTPSTGFNEWIILVALTIFHSTILVWMFSGGPLTFYISFFVLGGHTGIGSFGVFINFAGLLGASIVNMIITNVPATKGVVGIKLAHKIIASICIVGEFLVFTLFFKHDWSWNKNNWVHYVLLIVTGIVNSVFVGYTNIMMAVGLVGGGKVKNLKGLFYGIFYGGTNIGVTAGLHFIFKSFGQDRMINCSCKCFQFIYHFCFPTVYKTITGVLIALNFIALILICFLYN